MATNEAKEPLPDGQFIDGDSLTTDSSKYHDQVSFERTTVFLAWGYLSVLVCAVCGMMITYLVKATSLQASGQLPTVQTVLTAAYIFLVANKVLMAWFGVFTVYRFGGNKALLEQLKLLDAQIEAQAEGLKSQATDLATKVDDLQATAEVADKEQSKLTEIVSLGETITRLAEKVETDAVDLGPLLNDLETLQQDVKIFQRQIDKNRMMQTYHQISANDQKDGMSKKEYDLFMDSLDKQTRDAWRENTSWRKLRKTRNDEDQSIVDAEEFQKHLDHLFDRLEKQDTKDIQQLLQQELTKGKK